MHAQYYRWRGEQAIFGFDLKTALLGMLTSELSSRDLYPVSSDVLMVKNPEKIFSKSKEELENIVAERFSALADAGEGDATFYYMPADVFEGAAKAGNDEDKISDLLLKSMLYVVEVGSVQNFSHIL